MRLARFVGHYRSHLFFFLLFSLETIALDWRESDSGTDSLVVGARKRRGPSLRTSRGPSTLASDAAESSGVGTKDVWQLSNWKAGERVITSTWSGHLCAPTEESPSTHRTVTSQRMFGQMRLRRIPRVACRNRGQSKVRNRRFFFVFFHFPPNRSTTMKKKDDRRRSFRKEKIRNRQSANCDAEESVAVKRNSRRRRDNRSGETGSCCCRSFRRSESAAKRETKQK